MLLVMPCGEAPALLGQRLCLPRPPLPLVARDGAGLCGTYSKWELTMCRYASAIRGAVNVYAASQHPMHGASSYDLVPSQVHTLRIYTCDVYLVAGRATP